MNFIFHSMDFTIFSSVSCHRIMQRKRTNDIILKAYYTILKCRGGWTGGSRDTQSFYTCFQSVFIRDLTSVVERVPAIKIIKYGCFRHTTMPTYTVASLQCLRLNAVFLHISFIESPSVRRMCVYIPRSDSIVEKLAGLNSPCIVHVKSSVVVKVGIQLYLNVFKILLFDYACAYSLQDYKSLAKSQTCRLIFNSWIPQRLNKTI
jgi:hypothetical protein